MENILDHQIKDNLEFDFVLNNLRNEKLKIGTNITILIHSDEDLYYTNKRYKDLFDLFDMIISISYRGNSPDNEALAKVSFPF